MSAFCKLYCLLCTFCVNEITQYSAFLDLIGGGSRSTTPASVGSRKSSTTEQGTQAGGKKDEKKVIRPIQPPRGGKDRRDSRGESQVSRRFFFSINHATCNSNRCCWINSQY